MDTIGLLRTLSEAFGAPGCEDDVRRLVLRFAEPVCDDVRVDALGNVLATRRGRTDDVLMLDAHMDEVALMVSHVEPDGFLRLCALGGWDDRILPSHAVTIRTSSGGFVRGVIGTVPPHVLRDDERTRGHRLDDLYVDVGVGSAAGIESLGIAVGDPCVPSYGFEELGEDLVIGKAFDDRAGCTVALRTLEDLAAEQPDMTVVAAFTVSEEVGLRGARTAAAALRPRVALALEGTTAADVPGVPAARRPCAMGEGPAITVADNSLVADRRVVALLRGIARRGGIRHQVKVPGFGATDAGAIQTAGEGALCGVVSVPCRYIHTPLSMLRPSDLEATVSLVTRFVHEAGTLLDPA